MGMTEQEIKDAAPNKKSTHYCIDGSDVIYLKKNKNYGWDYWRYRWVYCCNWFKEIKPL